MANKITTILDLDDRGFKKSIGNMRREIADADGATNKFKAGVGSLGTTLQANVGVAAVAAGVALVAFGAKAVDAASRLEESTNAVNKSFGAASGKVLELGEEAAESVGLSQSAFNSAAVSFAGFAKQIQAPGRSMADVIGVMTQRSADFASVMNMDVTEAADTFRSALSGEQEPIKKFGIDMSAAAVEAYALAEGLVKNKSELTETIKVQARYGLLLQSTEQFAGDFADTSDGLANSSRVLGAKMEDLSAKIGEQLTPSIAVAVGWAIQFLDVVEAISDIPSADIPLFPVDLDESHRKWKEIEAERLALSAGMDAGDQAARRYSEGLKHSSDAIIQAQLATDEMTQATLRNEEAAKVAAVAWEEWEDGVVAATEAAQTAYDETVAATEEWAQEIRDAADAGAQSFYDMEVTSETTAASWIEDMRARRAAASEMANDLTFVAGYVQNELVNTGRISGDQAAAFIANLAGMGEEGAGLADSLANDTGSIDTALMEWSAIAGDSSDGMIGAYDPVAEEVSKKMDAAATRLNTDLLAMQWNAAANAAKIGAAIPEGVGAGIVSASPKLNAAAAKMINDALTAAKVAGQIESPSKLFAEEVGAPIAAGIAEGIVEDGDKINDALARAIESAEGDAIKAAEELVDAASDVLDGLWKGIDSGRSRADMVEDVADAQARLDDVMADPESTAKDKADALERLQDANYRLTKATMDAIQGTAAEQDAWRASASAAGLTADEIDRLVRAYTDLKVAGQEAATAQSAITAEAARADLIRNDFAAAVRGGLISEDQLGQINAVGPGEQLDWMKLFLNNIQRFFGSEVKAYATGGVVPGTGPQVAVVHGGETIIPAGQGGVGTTYNFVINDATDPDRVVQAIRQFVRRNGPVQGIT